jgi:hypothetical protein
MSIDKRERVKEREEGEEGREEECILCRERLNMNPIERPWGAIALIQPSRLLYLPLDLKLRYQISTQHH